MSTVLFKSTGKTAKTVLITGSSSGFGLETARYFLERGWNVIATMRTPKADLFPASKNLRILALDVTNAASIRSAVEAAGPIDVLVNNAGIGFFNALEGTPMENVRDLFETNTFGTIAMIQAVLPQFRERNSGTIINVTSSVTLKALPFLAAYTGSKAAVNAYTESLALELAPFNIRTHMVLPGYSPETRFTQNTEGRITPFPEPYAETMMSFLGALTQAGGPQTTARDVAETIWNVANDPASPLLLPAGPDAVEWLKQA